MGTMPDVCATVVFGLGEDDYSFDDDIFDSPDEDIQEMFYGVNE